MWELGWAPHTAQGLLVWALLPSDLLSSFHKPPIPPWYPQSFCS